MVCSSQVLLRGVVVLCIVAGHRCQRLHPPLTASSRVDADWTSTGDPLFFERHPAVQQWPSSAWSMDRFLPALDGPFTNTYVSSRRTFPYFDPTAMDKTSLFRRNFTPPFSLQDVEAHSLFEDSKGLYKL